MDMGAIPSGDITGASLHTAHKYEHQTVYFSASGKYLKTMVEKMLADHAVLKEQCPPRLQAGFHTSCWRVIQIHFQQPLVWECGWSRYDERCHGVLKRRWS